MEGTRLLLVEDEAIIALDIKTNLERMGFEVLAVESTGEIAIKRAEELKPDLILMDIILGGEIDGIEAVAEIKSHSDIPVIYLTAHSDEMTMERAKATAPSGYVIKPAKKEELNATIRLALYKHEMERELRLSEERYRGIVETMPILICRFLPGDGIITFVNSEYCRYFNKGYDELVGKSFLDLMPEKSRDRIRARIQALTRDNPAVTYEHSIQSPEGLRWQRWTDQALFDFMGNITEYQSIGEDITERKTAEERIRESEERLSAFINSATDAFTIWDEDFNLRELNAVAMKYLPQGTDREDVIGKNFLDFLPGARESGRYDRYMHVIKTGEPFFSDQIVLDPTFGERVLDVKAFKVGQGFGIITSDVTDLKKAKERIEQLSMAVEESYDGMAIADSDGYIQYANKSWARMHGYVPEELEGKHLSIFHDEEQLQLEVNPALEAARKMDGWQGEVWHKRKDGSVFPTVMSVTILRDQNGDVTAMLGNARDVSELKELEKEREERMFHLEQMEIVNSVIRQSEGIDEMLDRVIMTVLEIFKSDRAWLLYPCDPKEDSYRIVMEHTTPEYPGAVKMNEVIPGGHGISRDFDDLLSTDGPMQFGISHDRPLLPDKSIGKFSIKSQLAMAIHPKIGKPWVFGMHQCSYDRVWAEAEMQLFNEIGRRITDGLSGMLIYNNLKENEERYRFHFENVSDVIYTLDTDSRIITISPSVERILGYLPEDLVGKNFAETGMMMEEDIHTALSEMSDLLNGREISAGEYRFKARDGSVIIGELRAVPVMKDGAVVSVIGVARDITDRKNAERELIEKQKILDNILGASAVGIAFSRDRKVLWANEAMADIFGFGSEDEYLGMDTRDLYANEDEYRRIGMMTYEMIHSKTFETEALFRRKNGTEFYGQIKVNFFDPDIPSEGIIVNIIDVTRQKEYEQDLLALNRELIDSKTFSEKILNLTPGIIMIISLSPFKINYINDGVFNVVGYSREEIERMGQTMVSDLMDPEDFAQFQDETFPRYYEAADNEIIEYKYRFKHKNGRWIWLKSRAIVLSRWEDGTPEEVFGIAYDVTDIMETEQALRVSEKKYRQLHENMRDAFGSVGFDGKFMEINLEAQKMMGYTEEEARRLSYEELTPKRWHDFERRILEEQVLTRGYSDLYEKEYVKKDGTVIPVELRSYLLRDENEQPIGFWAIVRDISERKKMEDDLRESEKKYRDIVEGTDNLVTEVDSKGNFIFVNHTSERVFGLKPEQCVGRNAFDFVHPDDLKSTKKHFISWIRNGLTSTTLENRQVSISGAVTDMLWTINLNHNENGRLISIKSIARDITEIRNAERELEESREKTRALMDATDDSVFLVDTDGVIVDCNLATCRRFGKTSSEILGNSVFNILPREFWESRLNGVSDKLFSGHIIRIENIHNGRWYETAVYPIKDSGGEVSMAAVYSRDITDIRDTERQVMEAVESERRRFGQDLHDGLGQLLSGIGLQLETLKRKCGKFSADSIKDIMEIKDLVKDSIDQAKRISRGLIPVSLESYGLSTALEELADSSETIFDIECAFKKKGNVIIRDSIVAINLYYIAQEAVHNSVRHGRANRIHISMTGDSSNVRLTVQDNGKGHAKSGKGKGSGLGMKIMKYRANLIGAELKAESSRSGFLVSVQLRRK